MGAVEVKGGIVSTEWRGLLREDSFSPDLPLGKLAELRGALSPEAAVSRKALGGAVGGLWPSPNVHSTRKKQRSKHETSTQGGLPRAARQICKGETEDGGTCGSHEHDTEATKAGV